MSPSWAGGSTWWGGGRGEEARGGQQGAWGQPGYSPRRPQVSELGPCREVGAEPMTVTP